MRTVRQLLDAKASEIYAIHPDAPVIEAIRLMADWQIGALLVMEEGKLVGVVSERDYARKIVLEGRSSSTTPVRTIMTPQPITAGLSDTVDWCMHTMTHRRIRHLPVLNNDRVVGVISIGDLVKAVIEDQRVELDQLQRYIAS